MEIICGRFSSEVWIREFEMNEKCVDCEGRGLPNNALPGIKTQCLHFQKLAKLPNIHIRAGAGSNNFKTLNLLILAIIREQINIRSFLLKQIILHVGLLLREKKDGKSTFSKIKKIKNRISQSFGKLGKYEASINIRIQVSNM